MELTKSMVLMHSLISTLSRYRSRIRHFFAQNKYAKAVYQYYVLERPDPSFKALILAEYGSQFPRLKQTAGEFCQDGSLVLNAYIGGDLLDQMRDDFARLVMHPDAKTQKNYRSISIPSKLQRQSIPFSRFALDPFILALANVYWGRPVRLAQSLGLRYHPFRANDFGPNQWHHDAKGKQVKVYVLLTDVDENGQYVQIIPRSQRALRFYSTYEDSRFNSDYAFRLGAPVKLMGPAGTVFLFDSDCLHRATRRDTTTRDIWSFTYQHERNIFSNADDFHPAALTGLDPMQKYAAFLSDTPI